jgi:hypothetical protein
MAKVSKPSKPKVKTFHAKKPAKLHGVKKVKSRTVVLGS